tara:strand:- start:6347 stop:7639 length:1293 start_codon:yes stop_codon:yes gene_type:complete
VKNLYSNIISQSSLLIEKIFVQIFFPSLMLFFWGKENFNLWIFMFSIPSFLSLFQISIISPSRNQMSILFKNRKFKLLNTIYQNAFIFILFNSAVITLVTLVYIFLNLENSIVNQNIDLIIITLSCSIITFLIGPFSMALTYKGNIRKYVSSEIFFDIMLSLAIPFSSLLLDDFKKVFYVALFVYIFKILFIYLLIKDKNLVKFVNFKFFKLKVFKNVFNFSIGFNLDVISNILKGPGLIFLLGTTNNLSLTGLVSTSKTLFYFFPIRFLDILYNSYYLEITKFFKFSKFSKKIINFYLRVLLFVISLLIVITIFQNIFGLNIYNFWLNKKFLISSELILLITLDVFLVILINFITLPLKSINKYNIIASIDLFMNILTFVSIIKFNLLTDLISIFKTILFFTSINFILKFIINIFIFKKLINYSKKEYN